MKTQRLAVMFVMGCAALVAEPRAPAQSAAVTVCMDSTPQVLIGVQAAVSAMFARIGVTIAWRGRQFCPVGAGAIEVRLSHDAPSSHASADALAYARPSEGTVVVFLDRIHNFDRSQIRPVLAHVLVHEITHVLEGISRHSATGVMKAHWDNSDYFEMRRQPLAFAQEDVDLIWAGLQASHRSPEGVLTSTARIGGGE